MYSHRSATPTNIPYNLRYMSNKQRDSPTSSILKAPTPIFVRSRRSTSRSKKLKFANGPADGELLEEKREGSYDSASTTSTTATDISISDSRKTSYDHRLFDDNNIVEVAFSPVKKMKVSPDAWNAFLEYKKYKDYSSETEKTDYTYSRFSKFRNKEIIPGFRVRPNLCRNPISRRSSFTSFSSDWSPDINYSVKRTVYENSSSAGRGGYKFDPDTTSAAASTEYDRNRLYQNETTEFNRYDGYLNSSDPAHYYDNKYHSYKGFGDDGIVLRGQKAFDYSGFGTDKGVMHMTNAWDYDETDTNFITSTRGEEKPSNSALGRLAVFLSAIYATLGRSVTSTYSLFKDLFSRYILRRGSSSSYAYRTYPYNSTSAWKSWTQTGTYYGYKYRPATRGRLSNWWHESFLYALYTKFVSTMNQSRQYVRNKYYRSSRRGRLLWFLIPLLFLLAFWLLRAERDDAYVTNQITAFKCKANQYVTPVRSHMTSQWRKVSNLAERIFGKSLQPVRYLFDAVAWVVTGLLGWTGTLISTAFSGLFWIFDLFKDIITHFWTIFTNIFADIAEEKDSISNAVYTFFSNILGGIALFLGGIGNAFFSIPNYVKSYFAVMNRPLTPAHDIIVQSSDAPRLHDQEYKDLNLLWEKLRMRIDDLEAELRRVKEEKATEAVLYQKQLNENYKALQKYQVAVKESLRRNSLKPVQSTMHEYLSTRNDELKKWILARFMLKTDTNDIDEDKFALLMAKYGNRSEGDLKMLRNEFARFVRHYNDELSTLKTDLTSAQYHDFNGNDLSLSMIKRIVMDEIKLYDADKTGKVDFALRSAGGRVLGVKCTRNVEHCFTYNQLLGYEVKCTQPRKNVPELAISPGMAPGECWAFVGSQGYLILELSHNIVVTGFTMEHISRLLSSNGKIESAPKMFSMWEKLVSSFQGLKNQYDQDGYLFGDYEYKDNNETYQYFPVLNPTRQPFQIVELQIASNHGNPNYTCLYRIRVHGDVFIS